MPTAATSPVVVSVNLLIENEPVTCGTAAASRAVVITVVGITVVGADVVAVPAEIVVGDSKGVAVVDVVAVVDADVVGWFDVVGSTDVEQIR